MLWSRCWVVDTVVNKMSKRSSREALKELEECADGLFDASIPIGRKIRYRHLMIYLLRYSMYKLKNPDGIDINMPEHEHVRGKRRYMRPCLPVQVVKKKMMLIL
jgi:hypothetical protein